MQAMFQQLLFNIAMNLVKKYLTSENASKFIYINVKEWASSDGDMNDWDNQLAELLKP